MPRSMQTLTSREKFLGTDMRELLSRDDLDTWIAEGAKGPVCVQNVDLSGASSILANADLKGSVFLGCQLDGALLTQIGVQGGSVIPELNALPQPFSAFPTNLYDAAWLYNGFDPKIENSWKGTPDEKGWRFFMKDSVTPSSLDMFQSAAARLHDTALERATARFLSDFGRPAMAIMGGHDVKRDAAAFKQVVEIARSLRRKGYLIITGGGPGLMEAGNLGAFLATESDAALDAALADLPEVDFKSHAWLASAAGVRAKFNRTWNAPIGDEQSSLAIPTWLYGHEPPNLFSSHIAKLFYNSLREDGLVTLAGGGIIFGPGNAGTVQEVFQDLTQNYYRGALSATPMVFLDPPYWTRPCDDPLTFPPKKNPNKPLMPLIRQLAAEKDFLSSILLSDDTREVVKFLDRAPPKPKPGLRVADVRIQTKL
jgi:predicted Rossmann-fold nucleotide-binding protein